MKFIILNENDEERTFATLYSEKDYQGKEQKLTIGAFYSEQLSLDKVASIKLQPNCTILLYENAEKNGKLSTINCNLPNLSETVEFKPSIFVIFSHVSCYKDNNLIRTITIGKYNMEQFKEYDSIYVPDTLDMVFCKDTEKIAVYSDEKILIDDNLLNSTMVNINIKGTRDENEELSPEELALVAGGKACKANTCAAQACAANACVAQACPANACVTNVIPVIGLI